MPSVSSVVKNFRPLRRLLLAAALLIPAAARAADVTLARLKVVNNEE